MESRRFAINGLVLELNGRTLALQKLSAESGRWLDNSTKPESLWQLHVTDARGRIVDVDASMAETAKASMDGRSLRLVWQNVLCLKSGAGPFDVAVTVAPSALGPNLTAWRLSVRNRSKAWTIWHLLFPRLCGLRPGRQPAADRLFWPEMWGMQTTGWKAMKEVSGPCGGYGKHSAQFMGFTRGGRTLYFAAHDPGQSAKLMVFKPEDLAGKTPRAQMHFLAHPPGMTQAGNSYEQPYDVVADEVMGDWFDAARIYAIWVRRQTRVSCPPPHAFRGEREARDIVIWGQGSINPFPSDRVVTVNGKQGFKELVAELQAADIVVMPYINGRLWDHSAPSYNEAAERHAVCRKRNPQAGAGRRAYCWRKNAAPAG